MKTYETIPIEVKAVQWQYNDPIKGLTLTSNYYNFESKKGYCSYEDKHGWKFDIAPGDWIVYYNKNIIHYTNKEFKRLFRIMSKVK